MPIFAVLLLLIAAAATIPFSEGSIASLRAQTDDTSAERDAENFGIFATAAWPVARNGAFGTLSRSALQLPPGFAERPGATLHAWSDGTVLWVWSDDGLPAHGGPDLVMAEAEPRTVQVGLSDASLVRFRDGAVAARPASVPYPALVARIRL